MKKTIPECVGCLAFRARSNLIRCNADLERDNGCRRLLRPRQRPVLCERELRRLKTNNKTLNLSKKTVKVHIRVIFKQKGIAEMFNPDRKTIWWFGLLTTIKSQNLILDLDYQSNFCISIKIRKN